MTILWFVFGLVLLVAGTELLVRGAARMARMLGVAPLVIGLTVVAFGTSTPEMVVSVVAALEGRTSIAVANVVGSNVFNVLLILGVCALTRPLVVALALVRRDVPVMIGVSLVLWLFALDGALGLTEVLVFLAGDDPRRHHTAREHIEGSVEEEWAQSAVTWEAVSGTCARRNKTKTPRKLIPGCFLLSIFQIWKIFFRGLCPLTISQTLFLLS